jgi:hypothetical protein
MKIILISTLLLFFFSMAVHAQDESQALGEVETNWPGIHYQITIIKRIPPDRLLVVIRVLATPEAPPGGTMLGFQAPIPPNLNRNLTSVQIAYLYPPRPLSFANSIMTDEKTQQKYPSLPPVAPPGKGYRSCVTLAGLRPRQNVILTIQFAVPPPPPPDPSSGTPVKQTVSFLFPNAKAPIAHVSIPPAAKASEPTN